MFSFQQNVIAVEKDSVCSQIQNYFAYMFVRETIKMKKEINLVQQNKTKFNEQKSYTDAIESDESSKDECEVRCKSPIKLSLKNIAMIVLIDGTSPTSVVTRKNDRSVQKDKEL